MRWKETRTFVPSTAEENYELTHDIMIVLHDVLPYVVRGKYGVREKMVNFVKEHF